MAETNDVQLSGLLPDHLPELEAAVRDGLKEQGERGLPGVAWKVIGDKAGEAVREELDGGIYELMAKAWGTAQELREHGSKAERTAGERHIVHLGEHELAATMQPQLKVTVDHTALPPLRLTLEVKAKVKAFALTVQAGHIREVSAGECEVTAQLKCGEAPLHPAKAKTLKLPGTVKLKGDGVKIG